MEEDIKTQNQSSENVNENSMEDDGSWILDLIDLSRLENWLEHLQKEAKEKLKRNAKVFSKTDMDDLSHNMWKIDTKI